MLNIYKKEREVIKRSQAIRASMQETTTAVKELLDTLPAQAQPLKESDHGSTNLRTADPDGR